MSELTYEPLDDSHAVGLLSIWSDEDVIKFTNIKTPCTLEEVGNRITLLKPFDVFVVVQRDIVIGIIGCPCVNREKAQYGVFYQFHKAFWGKGLATASVRWLLEFMEHEHPHATLYADVVIDNIASEKILNKFSFKLVSKEPFERNGIHMQIHNYIK